MQILYDLPIDAFKKLVNLSLDEMTGYLSNQMDLSDFKNQKWSDEDFAILKKEIKSVFLVLIYSSNIKEEQVLKRLDEEKAGYLLKCFNSRKLDIALTVVKQQNGSIKPVLDDFDWAVKWVLGTSACTTMRYPLLKLDLSTIVYEHNEPVKKNISLELTKSEVDLLLSALDDNYNVQ